MSDATREEIETEHIVATLKALPGYPWDPCPICKGGPDGCCHTFPERARAAIPGLVLSTSHPPGVASGGSRR